MSAIGINHLAVLSLFVLHLTQFQPLHQAESKEDDSNSIQASNGQLEGLVQRLDQDGNLLWGCEIILGSDHEQRFRVLIDTGSSELWLASESCTSEACLARRRFDPKKSTTLEYSNNRTLRVNYGADSQVKGIEAKDRLQIAGVTIERQSFLLAHSIHGSIFKHFKFDGVLGLGSKYLSVLKALTPFEQMINQKLIGEPVFSLHLNPSAYLNDDQPDGELIFGSIHSNYSHFEFMNVSMISNTRWLFKLEGVSLKSHPDDFETDGPSENLLSVCNQRSSKCNALLDCGTPLIRGTAPEVRRLNAYLGAQETPSGLFAFPNCSMVDQLPNLVFHINDDDEVELKPREYVLERQAPGGASDHNTTTTECYSGLVVQNASEFSYWILGNMFLVHFHTLFDYANQQAGFVRLHDDLKHKYHNY